MLFRRVQCDVHQSPEELAVLYRRSAQSRSRRINYHSYRSRVSTRTDQVVLHVYHWGLEASDHERLENGEPLQLVELFYIMGYLS